MGEKVGLVLLLTGENVGLDLLLVIGAKVGLVLLFVLKLGKVL